MQGIAAPHRSSTFKRLRVLSGLVFALVGADAARLEARPYADLTQGKWEICEGIPDKGRLPHVAPQFCKTVQEFPIRLDRVFTVEPGSGVHDWTLETQFTLVDSNRANLVLKLAFIGENWEIFLNGQSLRREIYTSADGGIEKHRSIKGVVVNLPPSVLRTGANTVTFHIRGTATVVSFFKNDYAGFYMNNGYEIDEVGAVKSRASELFSFMLYGVYFFFGMYHIVLYLGNRQQRYNLTFGLFCIALSLYSVLISNTLFEIFPNADSSYLKRAEFITLFFMLPLFTYFFLDYFDPGSLKWFARSIMTWNITLSVCALILPFSYAKIALPLWQFTAFVQLGFLVFVTIRFALTRDADAYIMAATLFFTVFAAVFDIAASIWVFSDLRFFQVAFFTFIISIIVIIALRLRRLEKSERVLNEELRDLSSAFYRFVPTQVLDQMEKTSAADLKVGDNALRMMSVLFSDIRGFTALSEQMSPDDNFRFLNSYLARMEPLIAQEGGYVDKFLGDGIMALFSASTDYAIESKTTSDRALDAAIAMRRDVPIYNSRRVHSGYAGIDIGIGLHTGPLIIGAVGSSNRIDTTVIGNTVNVASRIEGMTAYYKTGIIISEAVHLDLTDPSKYCTREIGSILVRGKSKPIVLYEVFDTDSSNIIEVKKRTVPLIQEGITLFREKKFEEARRVFREALLVYSEDRVARVYYKLSQKFMTTPVPENWQGAIEVVRK